jgi:exonuclease SbcD
MKFLHLSDLHIGKTLDGVSLLTEQEHAFAQIANYIKIHHPNAVLIAGDVFQRAIPGVEAIQLFDDFLTALAGSDVKIMLIAGNHDSPERINFASRLLKDRGLFLYGSFNGKLQKITLTDEYGDVTFWLMPFIKPASLYGFCEEIPETYDEAVTFALNNTEIDFSTRNVLISHQFYTSLGHTVDRCESERDPIGGLDAVNASLIKDFDYAALGHLHKAQMTGYEHIRYCGTPVKYSFSEWRHNKSVTMVELKEKGNVQITTLPLTPIHDMRIIEGKLTDLIKEKSMDYIWATLTDETELIDPMAQLRSSFPNIIKMGYKNTKINIGNVFPTDENSQKINPGLLFEEFYLKMQGSTLNTAQIKIVRDLLEGAEFL